MIKIKSNKKILLPKVLPSSVKKTKKLRSRMIHSKALVKHFNDNLMIPSYKIMNSPSNAELVLNLEKDKSVYANGGLMVWMNSTIKIKTEIGGLFDGLKRSFLGDGSLFLTTYTVECQI